MSTFEFNEYGFCLNPEEETIFGKQSRDHLIVELAQAPNGEWCYGYSYRCYNSGGGGSPNLDETFPDRLFTLLRALDNFLRQCQPYMNREGGEGKAMRKMVRAIRKYRRQRAQLTLFDLF